MTVDSDSHKSDSKPSNRLARTAMWIGGSALFGSLALVWWNRRALRGFREAAETPRPPDKPIWLSDDDIY